MPEREKVRWSQLKVGVVGLTAFVIVFVLVFLLTSSRGIFQQNELLRHLYGRCLGHGEGHAGPAQRHHGRLPG